MSRYVCIHGHFYQPPRENPWLEEVEMQDSAYPYHDWNERITAECYGPNAAARILAPDKNIIDIINNYSKISFNFGPTLMSWMERHAPDVHAAIVEADRQSRKNFSGHGAAIAQVYNHMIMPLANARDKRTQVMWGITDFEHRFGRRPEGMWLAETAVDVETLEILAEQEILFTILAPRQARRVRRVGRRWKDVSGSRVDTRMPYLCRLPSGKTISLFFYDGPISQDIAFGGLLMSGEKFAGRLLGAFGEDGGEPQIVHIATDGETYGHHHRYGEMALAYCLRHIESNGLAKVTVYGEYLKKFPPTHEAEIVENTSWSCAHGIERWKSNCGCNSGREGWTQAWRSPLREALDWLRDELSTIYEREAGEYLRSPWNARDDYLGIILDRGLENVASFFSTYATRKLSEQEEVRVFRLLEMQRHAMLMYTSCGWFFDEISGLETTQVLAYAARAIQLAEKTTGVSLEHDFVERIRRAPGNVPEHADGAQVYQNLVKPAMVDLLRVGAHYAISSLFKDYPETITIYAYNATKEFYDRDEAGRQRLAIGRARLRSNVTSSESRISFAVLHLGDHNLLGGVREFADEATFDAMYREIKEAFTRSDLPEMIHLMERHFQAHNYSLWHLFRDEQRKVWGRILESALVEVQGAFRQVYDHHYPIMQAMREQRTPIPKVFLTTAEFTINADLRAAVEADQPDRDRLQDLVAAVKRWGFEADKTTLGFVASRRICDLMERFNDKPEDSGPLEAIDILLRALEPLSLEYDLLKAQTLLFLIGKERAEEMKGRAAGGDEGAGTWVERFDRLSGHLRVRAY
jgi:alpha-amylase/alpha-mannosidase (GH57 family)